MHDACFQFVSQFTTTDPIRIIEIGSRDINGSARPWFPNADYVGIDIIDGPGVDVVADAEVWKPVGKVSMVLCLEVLEHTSSWSEIIAKAATWIVPGGLLVVTCAGPARDPHSAIDGGPVRPGEYYRGLTSDDIYRGMRNAGLKCVLSRELGGQDVQAAGRKPAD